MIRFVLISIFATALQFSHAQEDHFKFSLGLQGGFVKDVYRDIKFSGYSYSSTQWYGTEYDLDVQRDSTIYSGLHLGFHFGTHIPIYKKKHFSVGIYPRLVVGRIIQFTPDKYDFETTQDYKSDPRSLNRMTFTADGLGFVRYYLDKPQNGGIAFKLLGGYRYFRYGANFKSPVIGLEIGNEQFTVGFYKNLIAQKQYREFSNGDLEVARTLNEFYFTLNFFFD